MSINNKLSAIQANLAVEKGQRNSFGNYDYRNAEDILRAVKPLLSGLTLITDTNIRLVGDRYYIEAVATLSDGESSISAKGYAREALIKKGMDEAQISGAATSYAKKYALGNLFAIDNEADADNADNTKEAMPILDANNQAEVARAVAIYQRDGNLKEVLKARQITPEVQAKIAFLASQGDA